MFNSDFNLLKTIKMCSLSFDLDTLYKNGFILLIIFVNDLEQIASNFLFFKQQNLPNWLKSRFLICLYHFGKFYMEYKFWHVHNENVHV